MKEEKEKSGGPEGGSEMREEPQSQTAQEGWGEGETGTHTPSTLHTLAPSHNLIPFFLHSL